MAGCDGEWRNRTVLTRRTRGEHLGIVGMGGWLITGCVVKRGVHGRTRAYTETCTCPLVRVVVSARRQMRARWKALGRACNGRATGWARGGGLVEQWRFNVAPDKRIHQTENRQNRPTESRAKIDPFEASHRLPHRDTLVEHPLAIPAGFLVGRTPLEARSIVHQENFHKIPHR